MSFWSRFRRRAAPTRKASASSRVILLGLNPGPVPHPNYDTLSRDGYESVVAVYDAINVIMRAAGSVDWVLYKQTGRSAVAKRRVLSPRVARKAFLYDGPNRRLVRKALETTEVETHPLLSLLERPNPQQSASEYIEENVGYYLLSGNSYEEFAGSMRPEQPPTEMYNLRPNRVQVIAANVRKGGSPVLVARDKEAPDDAARLVTGYIYGVGAASQTFADFQVLHRRFFHPRDDFYGLSPLQVALRAIRADTMAADWNLALLNSEGRPPGAFIAPQVVADDTFDRMRGEVRQAFSDAAELGMPMLLDAGVKWEAMGLSPFDLDLLEGRRYSRAEIASIFNVPPEIIGDQEHRTYNSYPEARKAFWHEAVLPLLNSMRNEWNEFLAPRFGEGLFVDFDRDRIEAIQEDRDRLWTRVQSADWLSVNEQREATGYDSVEMEDETPDEDVPRAFLSGGGPPASFGFAPPAPPDGAEPQPPPPPAPDGEEDDEETETATPEAAARRTFERKRRRITSRRQRRAMARLRRALKKNFAGQGEALAEHVRHILEEQPL